MGPVDLSGHSPRSLHVAFGQVQQPNTNGHVTYGPFSGNPGYGIEGFTTHGNFTSRQLDSAHYGIFTVFLAPAPTHLANNKSDRHRLQLGVLPAWKESGRHHRLCLVWALHVYIEATKWAKKDDLWVRNNSLRILGGVKRLMWQ